jgi:hypothetical protein
MHRTVAKAARRNFNPGTLIATVALFAALGTGTGFALPGKNKVDRNDIQASAVAAKQVKDGSLSGAELSDGSVTGADVAEASLGEVPAATRANSAGSAASAATAATATRATVADSVDGLSVRASTGIVRIPGFAKGQNVCKTDLVEVPGVNANDHVVMTSQGIPTYVGAEQVTLTVHAVHNDEVEVQGCLSADTEGPVAPTPAGFMFLVIEAA